MSKAAKPLQHHLPPSPSIARVAPRPPGLLGLRTVREESQSRRRAPPKPERRWERTCNPTAQDHPDAGGACILWGITVQVEPRVHISKGYQGQQRVHDIVFSWAPGNTYRGSTPASAYIPKARGTKGNAVCYIHEVNPRVAGGGAHKLKEDPGHIPPLDNRGGIQELI